MKIEKKHEGKTIYGCPTGNAARQGTTLEQFEVIKVKRIYVELREKPSGYTDNYHTETGTTQSAINSGFGGNSGYRWFETKHDYKIYEERCDKLDILRKFFRGWCWDANVSDDTIIKLYNLLNDENLLDKK